MMKIVSKKTKEVVGTYTDVKEAKAELSMLGKGYELVKVKTNKYN